MSLTTMPSALGVGTGVEVVSDDVIGPTVRLRYDILRLNGAALWNELLLDQRHSPARHGNPEGHGVDRVGVDSGQLGEPDADQIAARVHVVDDLHRRARRDWE